LGVVPGLVAAAARHYILPQTQRDRDRATHHEADEAWLKEWSAVLAQELAFAEGIASELCIVRVVESQSDADEVRSAWDAYVRLKGAVLPHGVRMWVNMLVSPYRTIVLALANFLDWQQEHAFMNKRVVVLLPREEHQAWWEWPLQRGIVARLRRQLRRTSSAIRVVDVPYTLV
jgi:hypothetical protein